jgi:hypothetical protein
MEPIPPFKVYGNFLIEFVFRERKFMCNGEGADNV